MQNLFLDNIGPMFKLTMRLILLLLNIIIGISATTHFILGDNGRIQSMADSILPMRRHYDLLSFLQHADQRDSMNRLFESMKARKATIDSQFVNLQSVSDVENTLHTSDVDCILKELYDVEFDFHDSIIQDGSFMLKDVMTDSDVNLEDEKEPDCKETFPMDFSMQTFEHFEAMRNRKNLVQHQEKSLIKVLPENMDLSAVGAKIAHGLSVNNTSWLHLNLASIYWRIRGDAYNALECGRRAIVTAPRKFRDIPLLTTGGVLHAANRSAEAAIVIRTAIEYAPNESSLHLALGNIYGFLGDYNKSVHYYDNSLKFSPTLDVAKSAKHNILCNLKLENSLTALHRQLLNILTELRAYHNDQTELLSYQETLLWEDLKQMPFLAANSEGNAEPSNYFPLNYGQSCVQKISGDQSIVSCDILSERQILAQKLQLDFGVSLQVLKNLENQAKDIRESLSKSKFTSDYLNRISQATDYSKLTGVFMEPTGRPMYQNFEIKKSNLEFENPDWPSNTFCENLIPKLTELRNHVPVYLPPDNKGFVTYLFLNELINIEPNKEHPLPWYPPTCQKPKSYDSKYITSELLKVSGSKSSPDSELTKYLTVLVDGAELAEIGQRILTAIKMKVAAPWVLSTLASLHWRIVGKDRNALDCLQLALDIVPQKYKDVPLVSIASINHKYQFMDNALAAIQDAFNVNPSEPMTNFLYGSILYYKSNYSGSMHHLKQCLRVKPYAMDGKALILLQIIACDSRMEYHLKKLEEEASSDGETTVCIGITDLPKKFANHNPKVEESIMCDKDGNNCKHVQCFSVNSDSDILSEFHPLN